LSGGSDGNEQLTAIVGTLLLIVLAIESATLLNLRSLLTMHAFVGMLVIPIVALKFASTGWRMLFATLTLPAADHLQDNLSGSVGVDVR
jgi:hypothetical protein